MRLVMMGEIIFYLPLSLPLYFSSALKLDHCFPGVHQTEVLVEGNPAVLERFEFDASGRTHVLDRCEVSRPMNLQYIMGISILVIMPQLCASMTSCLDINYQVKIQVISP